MKPINELYQKARDIVERNTGRPAYMSNDEEWYAAVEEARAELGITERAPVCIYCGSVAPYGDERLIWISVHQGPMHRWWYNLKRKSEKEGITTRALIVGTIIWVVFFSLLGAYIGYAIGIELAR